MYILNEPQFRKIIKEKGYLSLEALARQVGVHRNTLHYYLAGHRLFPKNFEKIVDLLGVHPAELLTRTDQPIPALAIVPVIDSLQKEFAVSFVLFGSRARGTARPYADWDIGVTSDRGIPHPLFLKMMRRKDALVEDLPFFVDLVNLTRADAAFLGEISKNWIFLGGRLKDWVAINKKNEKK